MPINILPFGKKNKSQLHMNQSEANLTSKKYDNMSSIEFLNNEVGNPKSAYQFLDFVPDFDLNSENSQEHKVKGKK
ncbi:hypothetical protein SS50377_22832 [Spironucleus salmonicida]|uniref:Uncharacterized protein n=1 Tax=Spironucleus salmonicida TaxID=348837 RepID=V6LTI5_9EUKA|nr:hypothetical protein SS50377_22832 [Spironucleus salmonicida]|eukprot:EST47895.1 Hypothetical protein SS50377_11996 [Spironucleus salmonicida]